MENDPQVLVSTDWLSSRLSDPEIRILDATWYLPNIDRDILVWVSFLLSIDIDGLKSLKYCQWKGREKLI